MDSLPIRVPGAPDSVLLISCSGDEDTGGGLCLFDGARLETIDRVSTAGLALFEDRLARLLRTPLSTGTGEILVYDRRGVSHYLRVDELSDAHYLVWDGKSLIVASTGTNSILWVSLGGEIVRRWKAPGDDDSWHLNDVYIEGDRLYACAFGAYERYRGYRAHVHDGDGFVFDVESGRKVAQGLCAPHNPRCFDGAWTVCDSLRSAVVQFEMADGRERRRAELLSFTRGLAVTDDYLVVGESTNRSGANGIAAASFAFLRRSDFSFVARFEVPFREISDIAVAPRFLADAVKTGFRTNPLRVGEDDQLWMFRNVGLEPARLWAVSEALAPSQCKIKFEAAIPSRFLAGQLTLVDCTITNLGAGFLCSALPLPVLLSYKWSRTPSSPAVDHVEGRRTRLPRMLPPGDSIRCRIEVLPPDIDGELKLTITLVQETVAWFDDIDPANGCSAVVKISRA